MRKPFIVIPLMLVLVALIVSGCTPSVNTNSAEPTAVSAPAVTETLNETATPAITSAPAETGVPAETKAADTELILTLDELAQYNGQNGNPAYIAVDGVIYDVTNVPQWKGGAHNGFTAGNDLTEQIKTISPHGLKVLGQVPMVGVIKE